MMKVIRWNKNNRKPIETTLIETFEKQGYHCKVYNYPPGTVFPEHKHTIDKIDAVLSGHFKIKIADESVILKAGDYIVVPADTIHRAEVVGFEPVISIDATKSNN